MRQLLCLIVVLGLFVSGLTDVTDLLRLNDHEKKEHKEILEKCNEKVGVSNQVLKDFETYKTSSDEKKIGCLLACYGEELGSLKSDGTLDLSSFTDKLSPYNLQVVKQCFKLTRNEDRCSHMLEAYKCYLASALKEEPYLIFGYPLAYRIYFI